MNSFLKKKISNRDADKYCKTDEHKTNRNEFASVTGWARRPDALGSGNCEGLPMGETSDRSPEGQRGSRVRIREGRGVPREQKSESPWGEKGSPE